MEELLLAAFNYQGKKSKRQRARATNGKVGPVNLSKNGNG